MLPTKPYLTQTHVQKILDSANQYATEKGHIVAIAVCDDGGHLLGLIRRDGCQPVSSYFAQEKARTAAMGKRETQVYEEMINKGRHNIPEEVIRRRYTAGLKNLPKYQKVVKSWVLLDGDKTPPEQIDQGWL
jgi:uncharacterized protein GlcG (DUF336 family)